MAAEADGIKFRDPYAKNFDAPPLDFMLGAWYVTHSTLPMWRKNQNVVITYSVRDDGRIDDLVEYNKIGSNKQKTVKGIDTPDPHVPCCYTWRGRGMLKIASSQWQVLAHGKEEGGWMVTYFEDTIFTPAGIDLYAKKKGGLSKNFAQNIMYEFRQQKDAKLQAIDKELFAVRHI